MDKGKITNEQASVIAKIVKKTIELGIEVKISPDVSTGPILSIYRLFPCGRTTISRLESLSSDIAVTLGVEDVLIKRMPGESAVGVFVPNNERGMVNFRDVVAYAWGKVTASRIPLHFGVNELGEPFFDDLTELPHLLIAGSTGSGKSTLLCSLLGAIVYTMNSRAVGLILSDTKQVEFRHFIGSPHLLFPPATSIYETLGRMEWIISEMESRLARLASAGFRNIHEFNNERQRMPFIIFVIDELAGILIGKNRGESRMVENMLTRIVQQSRAAGVYVIAATQRPSVDIITGSIKANFPARLTFRLPSEGDSRTIIGTRGAEHLLARGDMLYASPNRAGLLRLHAPFASVEDIAAVVAAAT